MRRLARLLVPALLLQACAAPLPPALPGMAWVSVAARPGEVLMAQRLDGQRVADGRFFQLSPGAHSLLLRFQFEQHGGGELREPQWRTCELQLRYADFAADQRYQVQAWQHGGYRVAGQLRDAEGRVLAKARVLRCGTF